MATDNTVLEQAMSLVDQERSYLREERRAYETFRERVSHATAESTDATGPSETTEGLLDAYRDEVMDTLDHETVYGYTLAESLEEELSPSIARAILSKEPLTQRRKRNLLLVTTTTIERHEEFCAELDDERDALGTFADELSDIEDLLKKFPTCSAREQPLDKLLNVWEGYDTLLDRCEQLLQQRLKQIREAERNVKICGKKHARNEFLYSELDTRYPVLSEIGSICERISSKREGEQSSQTTGTSTSILN